MDYSIIEQLKSSINTVFNNVSKIDNNYIDKISLLKDELKVLEEIQILCSNKISIINKDINIYRQQIAALYEEELNKVCSQNQNQFIIRYDNLYTEFNGRFELHIDSNYPGFSIWTSISYKDNNEIDNNGFLKFYKLSPYYSLDSDTELTTVVNELIEAINQGKSEFTFPLFA